MRTPVTRQLGRREVVAWESYGDRSVPRSGSETVALRSWAVREHHSLYMMMRTLWTTGMLQ